jgi:uncharacterized protein
MYQTEYAMQRYSRFLYGVYALMSVALFLTAGVAYYVASTPAIYTRLFNSPGLIIGLLIGQLALVFGLTFFLQRMSITTAFALFIVYAASLGLTLSSIFLIYTSISIYQTFVVAAGMFGVMGLYGYFTKTDLSSIGNIATMALFGLIIALLVNLYFKNQTADLIISGIGVLIFTLLTAYDTQKIKQMAQAVDDEQAQAKIAVLGALILYLDFINLFLFLLRFMGRQKE